MLTYGIFPELGDFFSVEDTINVDSVWHGPPTLPVQDNKLTPQWKKTVDERLGNLERNVSNLHKDMASKADLAKLKTDIVTEVKQLLISR